MHDDGVLKKNYVTSFKNSSLPHLWRKKYSFDTEILFQSFFCHTETDFFPHVAIGNYIWQHYSKTSNF